MAISNIAVASPVNIKSGDSIQLSASSIGAEKKEKGLFYRITQGKGKVDTKGVYTAPLSTTDTMAVIQVTSAVDPAKYNFITINIEKIDPLKIEPSFNLVYFSGGTEQFIAKYALPVNPYWHLVNPNPNVPDYDLGTIEANAGLYHAPEIVQGNNKIDVIVELVDRGHLNNKTQVTLELWPIKIEKGNQIKIHAGQNNVKLNLASKYDYTGKNNFTCEIVSRPIIGTVQHGGIYLPPKSLSGDVTVQVKATSAKDISKSEIINIVVGPQVCPRCHILELDGNGNCPNCGQVSAPIIENRGCPRCKSSQWDGNACPNCNYPLRRKAIF